MMKRHINRLRSILLIALAAFMVGASDANAQYSWDVAHTDYDGRYYYCFQSISCAGNTCTAAGSLADTLLHQISEAFFWSTDAGKSWRVQDPGRPVETDAHLYGNYTYFRYVQQIDSLHAAAIETGGSGIAMQTADGGTSWHRIVAAPGSNIVSVDFADPLHGVLYAAANLVDTGPGGRIQILYAGGPKRIFMTTDGGDHWDSVDSPYPHSVFRSSYVQGHCYGNGRACLFVPGHGQLFRTSDNWATIDSDIFCIDPKNDSNYAFILTHCAFRGLDTLVAYGTSNLSGNPDDAQGMIMHSTDGGKNWDVPQYFPTITVIQSMTSLERDTVLAGGLSAGNILMSTDHGMTWRTDSLLLDTNYSAYSLNGIAFTASGTPLAAYCFQNQMSFGVPSVIFRGSHEARSVEQQQGLSYHDRIFPNPATSTLNIASIEGSTPFRILDMLGRVAMHGMVGDHITTSLDVSTLPRGVYLVVVENGAGVPVLAGKLVLAAP